MLTFSPLFSLLYLFCFHEVALAQITILQQDSSLSNLLIGQDAIEALKIDDNLFIKTKSLAPETDMNAAIELIKNNPKTATGMAIGAYTFSNTATEPMIKKALSKVFQKGTTAALAPKLLQIAKSPLTKQLSLFAFGAGAYLVIKSIGDSGENETVIVVSDDSLKTEEMIRKIERPILEQKNKDQTALIVGAVIAGILALLAYNILRKKRIVK